MQSAPLRIRLSTDVTLAVPPSLDSITTYVLLEQETWFEKELKFLSRWLKPGMTAIERPWLAALLGRRPTKVASIALANKIARMTWAMMPNLQREDSPCQLGAVYTWR